MVTKNKLMTAEELFWLPDDGYHKYELVRGVLISMPPGGWEQGIVSVRLIRVVDTHVEAHDLGVVLSNEPGFTLERGPDTVRAPDLAFISKARIPAERPRFAFPEMAPDLVAEVVSPSDRAGRLRAKIEQWFAAGVRLIWVLYPRNHTIRVYRSLDDVRVLTDNDQLDGEDILPGFRCPIRDLFPY